MKQENEQNTNTTETKETVESVEKKIAETAYPDINKANTKSIVIISLIVVIILFLLSVFIPTPSVTNATTESTATGTTTEATTETSAVGTKSSSVDSAKLSDNSTNEETTDVNELQTMGQAKTSVTAEVFSMPEFPKAAPGFVEINGKTYYLQEGETPYTGWLKINDICYYIQFLMTQMISTRFQKDCRREPNVQIKPATPTNSSTMRLSCIPRVVITF